MKYKNIEKFSDDSSSDDSDDELREALARGDLQPGLNVIQQPSKKQHTNNVSLMKEKTNSMKLTLPWIERLDIVSAPAPLAPEFALEFNQLQERREKQAKGNKKLASFKPGEDPVLNDFTRENMIHRQAQAAVMDAIQRIKKLGIPTLRPEDYFAEMAKTDEHMHKVRLNLEKRRMATQRSEKVRQLRQQRKVGKQMQIEATLKKHAEKREMMAEVKKYRKGIRKDLNFLDDKNKPKQSQKKNDKKLMLKKQQKNAKFGFGGKKRGNKLNTRESAADMSDYRRPSKPGMKGKDKKKNSRMGKNRRTQMKAKRK